MGRRIDPQRARAIADMTVAGYTSKQIEAALGVSARTVARHRERAGLRTRVIEHRVEELREQVGELSRYGMDVRTIAAKLHVDVRTVHRYREKLGFSRPVPPRLTDEEKHLIGVMLDDGMSYAEIARTIGRSTKAVRSAEPGRGWTQQQILEYRYWLRHYRCVAREIA